MFNLFKNRLKFKDKNLNNKHNDKVVRYGENDNIYYLWEFNNEK